jgi:ribonucleoside-diphosphate reductase alpha chain
LIDTSAKPKETEVDLQSEFLLSRGMIVSVPSDLTYRKYKLTTGCGTLYFFLGIDEYDCTIYDCFTNTDGVGGCFVNTQANSRLLSLCLRGGIPINKIIEQLNKSGTCPSFQYQKGQGKTLSKGKSCPSVIANILKDVVAEINLLNLEENEMENPMEKIDKVIEDKHNGKLEDSKIAYPRCPECNSILQNEGGCIICKECGWSKCS